MYNSNQLEENQSNPKVIWKIIKSLLPNVTNHTNKSSKINIDGLHVNDPENTCNYINKCFVTVEKALANEIDDVIQTLKLFSTIKNT